VNIFANKIVLTSYSNGVEMENSRKIYFKELTTEYIIVFHIK